MHTHSFLISFILLGTLLAEDRPNIIFILADDMGYGDVQANNPNSKIPTPHLNSLARDGMTFTDAHSPSAVCTPTRYGVITGRYCWRSRLKRGVLNGYSPHLIDTKRTTVAKLLKTAGYYTANVGKWHLGLDFTKEGKAIDYSKPVKNGPNALGFEFFYGIPASLDFPPYVYVHNENVVEPATAQEAGRRFPAFLRKGPKGPSFSFEDSLDHLLQQATGVIREQAKTPQPFFLYFPLSAPHKPVLPHPRFRGKTGLGPYGDFVHQVDWTVGQVLKAVDDAGIRENTLIFYTSDNGSFMYRRGDDKPGHLADETDQGFKPSDHTANHIYRGTKADIWEAGHRVPFFARWPAKIKPNSKCDETICLVDLMATCSELSGQSMPQNAGEDSFSLVPLLEGRTPETPRAPVIHHSAGGMFSIRDGKWKLVLGNGSGGRAKPRGKPFKQPYHLFDMTIDSAETTNLVSKFPEVVEKLSATFKKMHDSGRSRR